MQDLADILTELELELKRALQRIDEVKRKKTDGR